MGSAMAVEFPLNARDESDQKYIIRDEIAASFRQCLGGETSAESQTTYTAQASQT